LGYNQICCNNYWSVGKVYRVGPTGPCDQIIFLNWDLFFQSKCSIFPRQHLWGITKLILSQVTNDPFFVICPGVGCFTLGR